jgi:hypothetical protein
MYFLYSWTVRYMLRFYYPGFSFVEHSEPYCPFYFNYRLSVDTINKLTFLWKLSIKLGVRGWRECLTAWIFVLSV